MIDRKMVRLGELGGRGKDSFAAGPFGSSVSSKNFTDSGLPMIRGSNLSSDPEVELDESNLVFLPDGFAERFPRSMVGPGDLVFTCWGTIGQVGLIGESSTYPRYLISNKQMKATLDTNVVNPVYAYYFLSQPSINAEILDQAIGSSVPGFNLGQLKNLEIALPSSMTQLGIAAVLGALDGKIAANRSVASSAIALARSLVTELSGSAKLGALVKMVRKSIDPSSLDVKSVQHFSLPAFDVGAASEEAPSSIKSAKNLLAEPVVLVSKLNPRIPRIWAVDRLPTELALASTEFVALAPKEVGIGVLWGALLDPHFTQSMLERTGGTTGSHQRVKPEQMLDVEVRDVRELTTEKRELLDSLCRKVNDVADENQLLAATRDELLPLLMSGKITVKDAEKTVEEVV